MLLRLLITIFITICMGDELLSADGALVIRSNVPEAIVFLDGNVVGMTNASGEMRIDQLPDGQFLVRVQKSGYDSRQLVVKIVTDKTSEVHFRLESITSHVSSKKVDAHSRSEKSGKRAPPAEKTVSNPFSSPQQAKPNVVKETQSMGWRLLLFVLVFLSVIGSVLLAFYLWANRQLFRFGAEGTLNQSTMSSETTSAKEGSAPPSFTATEGERAAGSFLAELEHKEELLHAGFISEARNKTTRQRPSNEIIIPLGKNDYKVND